MRPQLRTGEFFRGSQRPNAESFCIVCAPQLTLFASTVSSWIDGGSRAALFEFCDRFLSSSEIWGCWGSEERWRDGQRAERRFNSTDIEGKKLKKKDKRSFYIFSNLDNNNNGRD